MNELEPEVVAIPDAEAPLPATAVESAPVAGVERVGSVDVLRGVALLGILAMNIALFGWPADVYESPMRAPGYTWGDLALWIGNQFIFNTKMMTIFSMLFGAGLVLMSERAIDQGRSIRGVYYRRILVLLGIGLVHAYLIWEGDILVIYAMCGLFLYPFRRRSARFLVITGVFMMCLIFPTWMLERKAVRYLDETVAMKAAGTTMPHWRESLIDVHAKLHEDQKTKDRDFDKQIDTHRSGYARIVAKRAPQLFEMEFFGFILFLWWYVGGRMLLGMGLMKMGVFSATKPTGFYLKMMGFGYGLGFPLVICDLAINWHYDFFKYDSTAYATGGWWIAQELSGPLIALGHVGLVMLICRLGLLQVLTTRLAAVGRMALTNYLMQSLVFSTVFYGYGLGLYATVHRPGLALMVLAMWAIQLALSPIWLRFFRFGPAEWIWRSLTYGRPQPLLNRTMPTQPEPTCV